MHRLYLEDKICRNCQKKYNRNRMPCGRLEDPKDYKQRKFCSYQCSIEYRRTHKKEYQWAERKPCPICSETFPYKTGQVYCSVRCSGEAKRNNTSIEHIDRETLYYLLGVAWSDGSLVKHRKSVRFALWMKDMKYMNNWRELLTPSHKLYVNNGCYGVIDSNIQLIEFLVSQGMHCNKTYTLEWPKDLPEDVKHHFIRGFFDGDGCVYESRTRQYRYIYANFTCFNTPFMYDLFDELKTFGSRLLKDKRTKDTWRINITNKKGVTNFANFIYKGSTICLQRKKDKLQLA